MRHGWKCIHTPLHCYRPQPPCMWLTDAWARALTHALPSPASGCLAHCVRLVLMLLDDSAVSLHWQGGCICWGWEADHACPLLEQTSAETLCVCVDKWESTVCLCAHLSLSVHIPVCVCLYLCLCEVSILSLAMHFLVAKPTLNWWVFLSPLFWSKLSSFEGRRLPRDTLYLFQNVNVAYYPHPLLQSGHSNGVWFQTTVYMRAIHVWQTHHHALFQRWCACGYTVYMHASTVSMHTITWANWGKHANYKGDSV